MSTIKASSTKNRAGSAPIFPGNPNPPDDPKAQTKLLPTLQNLPHSHSLSSFSLPHTQSLRLSLSPMEPWLDDLADDLQSISFTSTATTAATENKRSTSSGSEATLTASFSSSARLGSVLSKPRAPSSDPCWSAIHKIRSESPTRQLTLSDLKFSERLGSGDIGSVYLAELKCGGGAKGCVFAAKVMDKKELISRSKEGRARTEREILELLDHPFLPTLYASIDAPNWLFLLTEFCPGGDLHVLRQRQPFKRFDESTVRCARYHSPFLFFSVTN